MIIWKRKNNSHKVWQEDKEDEVFKVFILYSLHS